MECPRCRTKTEIWPCPNCGFPEAKRIVFEVSKNSTNKAHD